MLEGKQACQLFRYLGFRERLCIGRERKAIGSASQGCLCSDRKVEAGSTPLRIRTGAFNKRRAGLRVLTGIHDTLLHHVYSLPVS